MAYEVKDVNEFYQFYENELMPIVRQAEANERNFRMSMLLIYVLVFASGGLLSLLESTFVPFVIGLVVIVVIFYKSRSSVDSLYKTRIMTTMLRAMGNHYRYRTRNSFGRNFLKDAGLYPDGYSYYYSDLILGKIGHTQVVFGFSKVHNVMFIYYVFLALPLVAGIVLMIAGIATKLLSTFSIIIFILLLILVSMDTIFKLKSVKHIATASNVLLKELFSGMFVCVAFNKKFFHKTYAFPRSAKESIRSFLIKCADGEISEVELEDSNFNKEFVVYTNDQQEARYLLTPAIMEDLYDMKRNLGFEMSFSFSNSQLCIAFERDRDVYHDVLMQGHSFEVMVEIFVVVSTVFESLKAMDIDSRVWTKK